MIKCIIIDDEKKAREAFEKIINLYFKDKLIVMDKASNVKDGVMAINKHNPDVVFLDIAMSNENGFKLFEYFDHYHFEVIFTTAYTQYAVEAIKYAAIDYLLKPINFIDLRDAIYRYKEKKQRDSRGKRMEILLDNLNTGTSIKNKVALPTPNGYQMESINNIIYCKADVNYTIIHTVKNEKITVSKTLKIIEDILPSEYFFRVHKSYLVNLNYIKKYSKNDGHFIVLENEERIDVAFRRVDDFIKALTNKRE